MKWNRARTSKSGQRSLIDDDEFRSNDAAVRWLKANEHAPPEPKAKGRRPRPVRSASVKAVAPPQFGAGLEIFCDGGCEPNPGAGGWGVAIYRDGHEIATASGGDPETTNNRMELTGLLVAIQHAADLGEPCTIWCDSQYAVKGATEWMEGWKRKGWKRGGDNAKPKNSVLLNSDL